MRPLFAFCLGIFAALSAVQGNAAPVTLDLDTEELGFTLTNGESSETDGVSVTFSNIVRSNFGLARVREDGLFLSREAFFTGVVRMVVTFNRNVVIKSYDVDRTSRGLSPDFGFRIEEIGGLGRSTALNALGGPILPPGERSAFDMGDIDFFKANVGYRLTHNLNDPTNPLLRRFAQLDELDVHVVPVPASAMLFASVVGAGAMLRRRRRAA
ncbi:MAG: hypothetical protein AAF862_01235 [Pseudomonadota bacterium]